MRPSRLLVLGAVFILSCGRDPLSEAKKMERLGRYSSAIAAYEKEALSHSSRAAEAFYRVGEIYRSVILDYGRARVYFVKAMDHPKKTAWSEKARKSLVNCPDYFPLDADYIRQTGDSQSGGNYMRTEDVLEKLSFPPGRFKLKRKIYAGRQVVSTFEKMYEKSDTQLTELSLGGREQSAVLLYPIEKNRKWDTLRDGRKVFFEILDDEAAVTVKAGEFSRCLKLKIKNAEDDETWKIEYYAPNIGFILAAAATQNAETRISELLSYTKKNSAASSSDQAQDSFWHWFKTKIGS